MKNYSTAIRKPAMCGGDQRKKRQAGSTGMGETNADVQSRLATGRATAKDKAKAQTQRVEELGRMSIETLRKIAAGPMSDKDTMLARKVLRDKGDKGAMPQSVDK